MIKIGKTWGGYVKTPKKKIRTSEIKHHGDFD